MSNLFIYLLDKNHYMSLHQLTSKQYLPITAGIAWEFLSDPENLKTITPDYMNFEILSGSNRSMYPGQIIQYKVTPFKGYSTRWVTEITHVKEGEYFVDEQRFGPYALWHHKHFVNEINEGIEMEDIIDYKIIFGLLGQSIHPIIKRQLLQIFNYREQKLNELFGSIASMPSSLVIKKI